MKTAIYIPVLFLVFGFCITAVDAEAQATFVTSGKIEYEKKVNMQKYIEDNSWTSEFKDKMPVYRTNYFNLFFDSSVTLFKTGREVPDDKWKNFWSESGANENVVQMDYPGVFIPSSSRFSRKIPGAGQYDPGLTGK